MRTRTVLGGVAALVVAAGVLALAVPVVRDSDALTTTIRTAPDAAATPETRPLPYIVRPLWTAPTGAATAPVEGPSVIRTGTDRVVGLDPATGRERWSYLRGNATLCSTARQDGLVLALFAKSHGCRDLVALDAATGQRRWYRTVELTTRATLTSGRGTAVVTGGGQMIAVETAGGLNRWTYSAAGCTLDPAVVAETGVATVARCAGGQRKLVVHPSSVDKAPSLQPLPSGSDPHVLAAAQRVAVLSGNELSVYSVTRNEDDTVTAALAGAVSGDDRLAGTGTQAAVAERDVLVVWTGATATGVDTAKRTVLWTAPATAPPTLVDGQVLLAVPDWFTVRALTTGLPQTTVSAATPVPAGAALSRIGRLVVAAGDGRVIAYG